MRPPPPPHDPRERILQRLLGPWHVRQFPPGDARLAYFTPRGLLHLQLWHPEAGVSVLTPSRLTNGRFEVFPVDGWKHPAIDVDALSATLERRLGVSAIDRGALARALEELVALPQRRALALTRHDARPGALLH
ncbi:MAG: hypothetical protein R3A51_09190 [Nannocystaceae bacterium]|nr:hypothetical protein [Myxococcales bacterium]